MKSILISFFFLALAYNVVSQPVMQATIRKGNTANTLDVYLKSSKSFSQKDEAMTLAIAIPAKSATETSVGTSGVTLNSKGPIATVKGLQPEFVVNNLGSTSREIVVSNEKVEGTLYSIYTFIFAGTAATKHTWTAGEEQLIFSIRFNGCKGDCDDLNPVLVNLANGGKGSISYWYFQANTMGDITNYGAPFYENAETLAPSNGGSKNGSALSTLRFSGKEKAGLVSSENEVLIYPNPVVKSTTVSLTSKTNSVLTLNLFDSKGSVALTLKQPIKAGNNAFPIDMSQLSSGVYTATVKYGGESKNVRVVKQ